MHYQEIVTIRDISKLIIMIYLYLVSVIISFTLNIMIFVNYKIKFKWEKESEYLYDVKKEYDIIPTVLFCSLVAPYIGCIICYLVHRKGLFGNAEKYGNE